MSEMRQRTADSYGEDRAEGRTAVLGMLYVSQVPDYTESMKVEIRSSKKAFALKHAPIARLDTRNGSAFHLKRY